MLKIIFKYWVNEVVSVGLCYKRYDKVLFVWLINFVYMGICSKYYLYELYDYNLKFLKIISGVWFLIWIVYLCNLMK